MKDTQLDAPPRTQTGTACASRRGSLSGTHATSSASREDVLFAFVVLFIIVLIPRRAASQAAPGTTLLGGAGRRSTLFRRRRRSLHSGNRRLRRGRTCRRERAVRFLQLESLEHDAPRAWRTSVDAGPGPAAGAVPDSSSTEGSGTDGQVHGRRVPTAGRAQQLAQEPHSRSSRSPRTIWQAQEAAPSEVLQRTSSSPTSGSHGPARGEGEEDRQQSWQGPSLAGGRRLGSPGTHRDCFFARCD